MVCALFIAVALRINHANHAVDALLDRADSLLAVGEADSAMTLLDSLAGGDGGESPSPLGEARRGLAMRGLSSRYRLLQADAMNKTYRPFTTDSILKEVVDYYDRHGTPNERLRARYLLGCAYRDMGESPQAIESYQDAISAADTTSSTCDFKTLSSVYSQMADVYRNQVAWSNAIEAHKWSSFYSLLAHDTIWSVYDLTQMAVIYSFINRPDSAEYLLLKARDWYITNNAIQEWALCSPCLLKIYLNEPDKLTEAKNLIELYQSESGLFDDDGELSDDYKSFYRLKARYFEQIGLWDSAEFYYRKMEYPLMKYIEKDPMYHGLLNVYVHRHIPDSIAKYALLYCAANDSSIAIRDLELTKQAEASFRYSRIKHNLLYQTAVAEKRRLWVVISTMGVILFAILSFSYWQRERRKKDELLRLSREYATTKKDYSDAIDKLQQIEALYQTLTSASRKVVQRLSQDLEAARRKYDESAQELHSAREKNETQVSTINIQMEELALMHSKMDDIKSEYDAAQKELADTQAQYASLRQSQAEEIEKLKIRVADLQAKGGRVMKTDNETAARFAAKDIVVKLRTKASKSNFSISEAEWMALSEAVCDCYPALMSALTAEAHIRQNERRVAMMTILGIRPSAIAYFIGVKENMLSKLKSNVNFRLFMDSSAATLYSNLERRYGTMM